MRAHLEHLRDEDVAQVLVQRHDRLDGHAELRQPRLQVVRLERATQQRLEPATRDDHGANWDKKRMSLSENKRMWGMP